MVSASEATTHGLIIGGGALGLLLAQALQHSQAGRSSRMSVSVLNRRPLPESLLVSVPISVSEAKTMQAHPRPARPLENVNHYANMSPDKMLTGPLLQVERIVLFMCLPPEETESAFVQWMNACSGHEKIKYIQFVFCNNGILTENVCQRISSAGETFSFLRAVFLVGVVRTLSEAECVVSWKGGNQVIWGSLMQNSAADPDWTDCWLNRSSAAASLSEQLKNHTDGDALAEAHTRDISVLSFLEWAKTDRILKVEREKFFTNFMLAVVIGPRLAANKYLFTESTEEFRNLLANDFAMLWGEAGVTAESLLGNLYSTVHATEENFNSLSVQGAKGRPTTMAYFLETIERILTVFDNKSGLKHLPELVVSVRKLWGMTG
jgi:hypothetical protein